MVSGPATSSRRLTVKPRIKVELLGGSKSYFSEAEVLWREQYVVLRWNECARHPKCHTRVGPQPSVADAPGGVLLNGVIPARLQQRTVKGQNQLIVDLDLDQQVLFKHQCGPLRVYEGFQRGERSVLAQVDHGASATVPATTDQPAALTREGVCQWLRLATLCQAVRLQL